MAQIAWFSWNLKRSPEYKTDKIATLFKAEHASMKFWLFTSNSQWESLSCSLQFSGTWRSKCENTCLFYLGEHHAAVRGQTSRTTMKMTQRMIYYRNQTYTIVGESGGRKGLTVEAGKSEKSTIGSLEARMLLKSQSLQGKVGREICLASRMRAERRTGEKAYEMCHFLWWWTGKLGRRVERSDGEWGHINVCVCVSLHGISTTFPEEAAISLPPSISHANLSLGQLPFRKVISGKHISKLGKLTQDKNITVTMRKLEDSLSPNN